ncbi:MAG: heme o synthase [bacterium]
MKATVTQRIRAEGAAGRLWAIWQLGKPRLSSLVLVSAALGYILGAKGGFAWISFAAMLAGILLVSWGIHALNQYIERDIDAIMERTRERPLPAGTLPPEPIWWWGWAAAGGGVLVLALGANPLAAGIGLAVVVIYIAVYTPLKRVTQLNTLVGAVPGALPPVLGWAAATGKLDQEVLSLFLIMYIWQLPHFMSIAWLYREDFRKAGLAMIAVDQTDGWSTRRQLPLYTATLLLVSLHPTLIGMAGQLYFFGALALGSVFLAFAVAMAFRMTDLSARRVLRVSVLYLPLLLLLLVYDSKTRPPELSALHVHTDSGIHLHALNGGRP